MIDISLIEKLLFSNKYTAKELATRWQISESAIKAYRQNKGSVGWRDWKGISIGKAEDIMKREGLRSYFRERFDKITIGIPVLFGAFHRKGWS